MSFLSRLRPFGRNRQSLQPAAARADAAVRRDLLVNAAIVRAGNPPRI